MQLYLFFFKLLMIPEIAITLNQISACIAYKSVSCKRHVILFWRNNFLLWVSFVFILYLIWTSLPRGFAEERRFLKIRPLQKTFQPQQINKMLHGKNLGFFHLGSPKTAFLMRNLTIDPCHLGIFPNKRITTFNF